MEDWQEMLIIILVVLTVVIGYFVYMGERLAEVRDSLSDYNDMKGAIDRASGSGVSSPVKSPVEYVLSGIGI